MIPIKVQCGCGQRYAFEVEAVAGRMPSPVACPVCGADGTAAANEIIARSLTPPAAAPAPASGASLRVAVAAAPAPAVHLATAAPAPAHAPRGAVSHVPRMDRAQAEHEAKAKVSWGDPPEAVVSHLMIHGLSYEEASGLVQEMFKERAATIRRNGFIKILTGIGLACVPVVAFFVFTRIGYLPLKIFAMFVLVGLWGAWRILKGLFMVLAPKSEPGDVAEQ